MAGSGRRRVEVPGRMFRLAVRELRAAAAAPENLGAHLGDPEEAMPPPPPPPPQLGSSGNSREAAATQERYRKKRRADSVGDEGQTGKKLRGDSVLAEADTSKKCPAVSIAAEAGTSRKKRSQGSRLSADSFGLFKGKPRAGESTLSTSEEIETNTSAERPKSFKKNQVERGVHETREEPIEEEGDQHDENIKYKGTAGRTEIENRNLVQENSTKAKDDDELENIDASEKAKNDMATVDFLAELEEKYSLDIYRQRFAHKNNLPIPPPSWDRLPTPPTPSSPPPIVEIGNYEQAKTALKAWNKGCHMQLQVSELLLLSDAEPVIEIIKDEHAERVLLNPLILEAKASQAKFLRQMINHTIGELQLYNQMLALPWIPSQTVAGNNLLQ